MTRRQKTTMTDSKKLKMLLPEVSAMKHALEVSGDAGEGANPDPNMPSRWRPGFDVVKTGSLAHQVKANGQALLQNAFEMAVRAAQGSGDGFEQMVYVTLLQKMAPSLKGMVKEDAETPEEAKEAVRRLNALLARVAAGEVVDGEFEEVKDG